MQRRGRSTPYAVKQGTRRGRQTVSRETTRVDQTAREGGSDQLPPFFLFAETMRGKHAPLPRRCTSPGGEVMHQLSGNTCPYIFAQCYSYILPVSVRAMRSPSASTVAIRPFEKWFTPRRRRLWFPISSTVPCELRPTTSPLPWSVTPQ